MKKYHLNPETGEPGSCRARKKCPFGDTLHAHYESPEEARKFFEIEQEFFADVETMEHKPHKVTQQALASNLAYAGPKPQWFDELEDNTLQKKLFGTETELLDVVEIDGVKYAVCFDQWSIRPQDIWSEIERGFQISRLTYRNFETGELDAYLNMSNFTDESLKKSYKDDDWQAMRFFTEMRSFYGMEKIYKDNEEGEYEPGRINPPFKEGDTSSEAKEAKIKFINEYKRFLSYQGIYPDFDPIKNIEGLSHEDLDKILEERKRHGEKLFENQIAYYKDQPFVDYSSVGDHLRGQGLGESLYIFGAKRLEKDGLTLRGSGLQTDEAQKLWKRLATNPELNLSLKTRAYSLNGEDFTTDIYPILDMRKHSSEKRLH